MKKETENLCAACGIGQHCCTSLSILRLSKPEFERNFFRHRESLLIRQYHGIYEVSGRRNKCPNWDDNQCAVYQTRPIECRIFPYTIGGISRIGRLVLMTYHHRTRCPQKDILLAPRSEVLGKLRDFAEQVFGRDVRVMIFRDVFPFRVAGFLIRPVYKLARLVSGVESGDRS